MLLCLSVLTSCSDAGGESTVDSQPVEAPKVEELHELNIRAPKSIDKMTAVFVNTSNGNSSEIDMTKSKEADSYKVFCCNADVNLYNMVHLIYDDKESMAVAFNSFVSGWNIKGDMLLPYVVGKEPVYDPQFETKVFQFDGRDKSFFIWTPEDYDAKSDEKYSVIYLFDGQSVLTTGIDRGMDNDTACWNVCESVESMMAATPHKAIIVAVDNNDVYRWDELVPDLGEINMEGESADVSADDLTRKRGSAFADFLCDTIMPYVNQNYSVYTDAQHTALAGSSLGGLETFYTVLSHPDRFGTGGVMSATFDMYADKEWTEFLKDKLNMQNAPTFPELWTRIEPLFSSGLLVAHNAVFDMGVLKKCLRDYGIDWRPYVRYICTVQMGRRLLPGISHKLNDMCEHYGICLNHHQADSDSRACAEILLHYLDEGADVRQYIRTCSLNK